MICKKCKKNISGDCMLTGNSKVEGICVFCHYNIDSWDSNGKLVTKKESIMLEINAIQCPNCNDIIFSRARHDFHSCSCGETHIDGGFDYIKVAAKDIDKIIHKKIIINSTKEELYNDWNKRIDKFGVLKSDKSKNKKFRKTNK